MCTATHQMRFLSTLGSHACGLQPQRKFCLDHCRQRRYSRQTVRETGGSEPGADHTGVKAKSNVRSRRRASPSKTILSLMFFGFRACGVNREQRICRECVRVVSVPHSQTTHFNRLKSAHINWKVAPHQRESSALVISFWVKVLMLFHLYFPSTRGTLMQKCALKPVCCRRIEVEAVFLFI